MNGEQLLFALTDIDDRYILEADPTASARPVSFFTKYRRYIAAAASFALVIGLGLYGISRLGGAKESSSEMMKSDGFAAPETVTAEPRRDVSPKMAAAPSLPQEEAPAAAEASEAYETESPMLPMNGTDNAIAEESDLKTQPSGEADCGLQMGSPFLSNEEASEDNSAPMHGMLGGAPTEKEPMVFLSDDVIFSSLMLWDDRVFEAELKEYEAELPDGFLWEGTVGPAGEGIITCENEALYGYPVFLSTSDVKTVFVGFDGGYVRYVLAILD